VSEHREEVEELVSRRPEHAASANVDEGVVQDTAEAMRVLRNDLLGSVVE
jgi:hypothetical protein